MIPLCDFNGAIFLLSTYLWEKTSSPLVTPAFTHCLRCDILSIVTFPWTTTLLLISATTALKGRLWPFTHPSPTLWEYLGKDTKNVQKYLHLPDGKNDVYPKLMTPTAQIQSWFQSYLTMDSGISNVSAYMGYIYFSLADVCFHLFISQAHKFPLDYVFTQKYFSLWIFFIFPKLILVKTTSTSFLKPQILLKIIPLIFLGIGVGLPPKQITFFNTGAPGYDGKKYSLTKISEHRRQRERKAVKLQLTENTEAEFPNWSNSL